jgi:hypothetical protein
MKLIAQPATVGVLGVDTITPITLAYAKWLVANGYKFVCRYLGSLSIPERDIILGEGLALFPVCYANELASAVYSHLSDLRMLAIPPTVTVWSDIEGDEKLSAPVLIADISGWAGPMRAADFDPGGYFGDDTLLTGLELGQLPIDRYWLGAAEVTDRFGNDAYPKLTTGPIGWCMKQACPGNLMRGGTLVDINMVYEDHKMRSPTWVIGVP